MKLLSTTRVPERRIELMEEQRKAGALHKGGRPSKTTVSKTVVSSLAKQGHLGRDERGSPADPRYLQ
jgi:hypothetical protein